MKIWYLFLKSSFTPATNSTLESVENTCHKTSNAQDIEHILAFLKKKVRGRTALVEPEKDMYGIEHLGANKQKSTERKALREVCRDCCKSHL